MGQNNIGDTLIHRYIVNSEPVTVTRTFSYSDLVEVEYADGERLVVNTSNYTRSN